MKSISVIGFICLFSCVLSGQTNKQDSFTKSFTATSYSVNNKVVEGVCVVAVDWYANKLTVMGGDYQFKILDKKPSPSVYLAYDYTLQVIDGDYRSDETITLTADKSEELISFYSVRNRFTASIKAN